MRPARSALRENAFTGTVHIVVYDRAQAEFLASFLNEHGLPKPELVFEDIGIASVAPRQGTARPSVSQRTTDPKALAKTAAERKREQRAREKKAKLGTIVVQPRLGRPSKAR